MISLDQLGATVVVAGHICLDIIPVLKPRKGEELFAPGTLVECGGAIVATGGAVSNTGLALHRLGVRPRLVGKVGTDLFGRAILETLNSHEERLADDMVVVPATSSSYTVVISPPETDRSFLHCSGANDTFCADDVRDEVLEGAGLFHFGYPPLMRLMYAERGAESERLFARAKQSGLTTSLDMALPDPVSDAGQTDWPGFLARVLPLVDLFLPSIDEVLYMLDRAQFEELQGKSRGSDISEEVDGALLAEVSERLIEMGAAIVALKLGARGLYLRTAGSRERMASMKTCPPREVEDWLDRELYIPCFEVDEVGSTGAGDCTVAGFLAALLRGLPPEETMRMAVAAGACCVEAQDAWSGVQAWAEIQSRIAAGWTQRKLSPRMPTWCKGPWIWRGPREGAKR